jgi:hypothetical protein
MKLNIIKGEELQTIHIYASGMNDKFDIFFFLGTS